MVSHVVNSSIDWFACGELEQPVLLFRDPTSLAVQTLCVFEHIGASSTTALLVQVQWVQAQPCVNRRGDIEHCSLSGVEHDERNDPLV